MTSPNSFANICKRVCEERDWELLPSGVNVSLEGSRHQVVSIELFEYQGEPMARLMTTIGSVAALGYDRMVHALRLNTSLPLGALGIREESICMTHSLILEYLDPHEFEATLEFVAEAADAYEKILFRTDNH